MNLVNQSVKHKMLGIGTVISQNDQYITIEFSARKSIFPYPHPDTFTKFLQATDEKLQAAILQKMEDIAAAIEAQKRAAEEALRLETERKLEEARRIAEASAPKTSHRKTASTPKRAASKQERIPGKRMTFYVFQGSTFDRESLGGYIWAPIANKSGETKFHWDNLLEVRPGDIILHGDDGYVKAISTARGECYNCVQPKELQTEDMWDLEGRRVDCDYILIQNPIKTFAYVDDIIRLCNVKYAPFNKYGSGNMGYLFEINRELAKIFVEASVKANPYLLGNQAICDLLSE